MNAQRFTVVPHPFEDLHPELDTGEKSVEMLDEQFSILEKEESSTLLLLQAHGGLYPEAPSFHIPKEQEYTDPLLSSPVVCDRELASQIQKSFLEYDRKHHVLEVETLSPVATLIMKRCSEWKLPPKLLVMSVSFESLEEHYKTGTLVRRALLADSDKVSVLVSGHLSHCLSKESAAGFVPGAKDWSKKSFEGLQSSDPAYFLYEDSLLRQEMGEDLCAAYSMGLGIIEGFKSGWDAKLQYEEEKGIALVSGVVTKKEA
jgi:aromatic ring-opening dioxygenase LigB subunit